ncbi:hypothetical protein Cgig2_005247 [Carnegiea gigantea]|uniref:F-box associated beta-propeller type 1 domain-containing protein n=1 Tax=Carnegiea gigantea TaxID=171969 RepID=A0A9Q1K4L8_9CARY|nr:hypothetical protein Cgig2_005247 [Carnegiea gigantea]
MESELSSSNNFDADVDYLSAESNVDSDDLSAETSDVDDDHEELTAGLYFSLPDIVADFDSHLTEPLFPSMSSNDFFNRFFSLDLDSLLVSGLVLIPKHTIHEPQIEYVSLSENEPERVPDFAFFNSQNLQILQSCNGFFLCFSLPLRAYSVCNLATQEVDVLLSSEIMVDRFALNLVYDPYISAHYKVISVQNVDRNQLHQLSIYSSESRLWTLWGEPFEAPHDLDFNQGVFCNGAVHWMRRAPKGLHFDVEKEELKEMPKPPMKQGRSLVSCEYFGESQGRLYYVLAFTDLPYLEVFEMKEDYTDWILKTQIDLKCLSIDFPIMARRSNDPHPFFSSYECDVLFISHDWGEEGVEVVLSIPGQVIAYNQERTCARKLCDLQLGPDDRTSADNLDDASDDDLDDLSADISDFDFDDDEEQEEELREMPKPPSKEGLSFARCKYFGDSQDSLYYVLAFSDLPYLEVFKMKEECTSWILKTKINMKGLSIDSPIMACRSNDSHPCFSSYECDVLFISHHWAKEGVEVVLSIPSEVMPYNKGKKCARKLYDPRAGLDVRAVEVYYIAMGCYYVATRSTYTYAIKNSTASAETIGHNEDILTKILLHLPAKPVTNFKLVSKQWLSLISSPQFLRRNVKILQSCNGLLLFSTTTTQYGLYRNKIVSFHGQELYVLNPTTQKSKLLPRCPDQIVSEEGLELNFSATSPPCYTLAFDGTTSSHYKVICVRKTARDRHKIVVYSSESKLWRLSKALDFLAPRDIDFKGGVYCNRAVHWTKRTHRGLYFDVENEEINHMPELPRKEHYSCEYFGQSKGCLYCVFTMEGLHYYELFEMEKDYSSWFLKSKIELDALAFNFPKMTKEINYQNPRFKYQCHVLSVLRGRNGKVVKIILSIPGEIIAYNCKKKTSWKICNSRLKPKDRRLWYGVYDAYEYFETLYPVNN